MAKIRKSSVFSKLITTFAIFLTVLSLTLAVAAVSVPRPVFAAESAATENNYSAVGQTELKTTYLDGNGSINGQTGLDGASATAADDFSFTGNLVQFGTASSNNKVEFGIIGMNFVYSGDASNAFTLRSNKKIAQGSALYKALTQAGDKYDVRVRLDATTSFSRDQNTVLVTSMSWDDGSSNVVSDSREQSQGGQVGFDIGSLPVTDAGLASLTVDFSFPKSDGNANQNTNIDVSITNVRVSFIVSLKSANYEAEVFAKISGTNRADSSFSSTEQSKRYVKSNDTVSITLGLKKDGEEFFLGSSYREIFSRSSAVVWKAELKASDSASAEVVESYDTFVRANETDAGQTYTFEVPTLYESNNGMVIVLTPTLNTDTSSPNATLSALQNFKIVLTVDSVNPSKPQLTSGCELSVYFERLKSNPDLFFTNSTIGINWMGASAGGSKETLYYTVKSTSWATDVETPTSNSPKIVGDSRYLNFFPDGAQHREGSYALALMFIDEAGNTSEVATFDSVVKVDDNDYAIYARAKLGVNGAASAASGASEFGTFRFNGNKAVESVTAKRGETVSLVYSFSTLNLRNYYLSNVYNAKGGTAFSLNPDDYDNTDPNLPTFTITTNPDTLRTVYTITFTADRFETVDFISEVALREFTFIFKRRVYPNVTGTKRVFRAEKSNGIPTDGTPQTVSVDGFYYWDNGTRRAIDDTLAGQYQIYYGKAGEDGTVVYGSNPFTLAGNYRYKIELRSNSANDYYCFEEGDFIIEKAEPGIVGFEIQPPKDLYSGTLPAIEFSSQGGIALFTILSRDAQNSLSDTVTSIGLRGRFQITNMSADSDVYKNPSVGKHSLSIVFVPEEKNESNGVLNADNYAVSSNITAEIAVLKKDLNNTGDMVFYYSPDGSAEKAIKLTSETEIYYNGNAPSVFINMGNLTQYGISSEDIRYEYRVEGGDYGSIYPVTAGRYNVRATISDSVGSYTGTVETTLEIRKQALTVLLSDLDNPTEFVYGYYSNPSVRAKTADGGGFVTVSFTYRFKAKGAEDFTETVPENAGSYQLEAAVLDRNYEGRLLFDYTIRPVRNGDAGLTVNNPMPQTNPEIGAQLRFGMPLSALLLSAGSVTYEKADGSKTYVAGSFAPRSISGHDAAYVPTAEEILKSNYYAFDFAFTPTGDDAVNFEVLTNASSVDILPANAEFSGISIPETKYGSELKQLFGSITGKATYGLFNGETYVKTAIEDGVFEYVGSEFNENDIPTVGVYVLPFRFRAADGKSALYRTDEFQLTLTVTRNAQELYVVSETGEELTSYRKKYGTEVTVPAENVKTRSELKVSEFTYRYFKTYEGGVPKDEIEAFGSAGVGSYYLEISIQDANYSGSVVLGFEVEKFELTGGTNVSQYPAALKNLEWGVSVKAFESQNDMNGSVYRDDAVVESLRRVDGTFSFCEDKTFNAPSAGETVSIRFTPKDTDNYTECVIEYEIPVNKRTVSFEYDAESVYNAKEQSPAFVLKDNGTAVDADSQQYIAEFTGGTPLAAGEYTGVVRVSDSVPNYRGESVVVFTVKPQEVKVTFDVPQSGYDAGTSVLPKFEIGAEGGVAGVTDGEVKIAFTDVNGILLGEGIYDGSVPAFAPKNVGRYTVSVTVGGNHSGLQSASFDLKPLSVNVDTSVVVTYPKSAAQKAEITPIRDGYEYHYTLLYRLAGTTEYSESTPTDVGLYEVRVALKENGYENNYDLGVKYTVTQLEIKEIVADNEAVFRYGIAAPNVSFTAYGAGEDGNRKLSYTLRYYDETGTALAGAPAHAGVYTVEATLNERNYSGSARFDYRIERGDNLRNVGSVETAAVSYKEEFPNGTDGIFQDRGTFLYDADGAVYEVTGVFSIIDDGFTSFGVGEYALRYEFRATGAKKDGVLYEISDGDIENYRGVTNVTVGKRTLTREDFAVTSPETDEQNRAVTTYDETQKGITLAAIGAFISPKEARDLAANAVVTYRNAAETGASTTAKPSAAGTYEVSVSVKHDNYAGSFTVTMIIEKAKPRFETPNFVKKAKIGEEAYAAGDVVTAEEPLYAYYQGKKGVPIAGKFTVKNAVKFEKANLRAFDATFTPDDTANVETVESVTLYVYVIAKEENRYEIKAEWFRPIELNHYGLVADVSSVLPKDGETNVKIDENGAVTITIKNGEIKGSFVMNEGTDALSGVGNDFTAVYFVPDETQNGEYQIVSFFIPLTVKEKAVVRVGEGTAGVVYATVSAGSAYEKAIFNAELSVISTVSDGVRLTPPSFFRFADGFDAGATVPANFSELPTDARAVYVGGDNFHSENESYEVRFVYEVKESGIFADRLSYQFHLNPELAISVENGQNNMGIREYMGISVSGAGDTVPDFTVTVEAIDVPLVSDAAFGLLLYDVGTYRVRVEISKSSGFYGEKTFLFEITKRDVGDYITVNDAGAGTTFRKTYLESLNFLASANSPSTGNRYEADYKILFREKDGAEFTESPPVNAGSYVIRAEVDVSDRYYGYRDFDYVILKKQIVFSQPSVSYPYGAKPAELQPRLDENVAWKYEFADENGNVIYNAYPENAGEYAGKITIVDANYQGSANFTYTVSAAEVTLTKLPSFQPLRYGQKLSEAVVSETGSAEVNVGGKVLAANGTFEFINPDAILDSGTNHVELRFVPENKNYQTVNGRAAIEVTKASVTIGIDATEFRYDGAELDLSRVYTIYPSTAGIVPSYEIRKDGATGELLQRITDVGTYYVAFTVDTVNYYQRETAIIRVLQGTADANQQNPPRGTSLVFGQRLKNSALTGGSVLYNGVAVLGTFRYALEDATADWVGDVEYPVIFTPNNANYAAYTGYTVTVAVFKAPIEILVSGNECVYGETVREPTFTVNNIGGTEFRFDLETEFTAWIGKVMPAGTISTKVTLKNDYYYGEKDFVYTVKKKSVGISFYTDGERKEKAETYSSVYGNNFTPYPGLNPNELVGQYNLSELNARISIEYRMKDGTITVNAPKNAGEDYSVIARYVGENYNAQAEIRYTVKRAKVTDIRIDSAELNKQIYGSVTKPNVVTSPAGVGYELDFGNGQTLPKLAGNYHLTVTITDSNYERTQKGFVFIVNPKVLVIENIVVSDKIYDGVAQLEATGTLSGLRGGDEVTLTIAAETADKKTDPGEYGVVITSVVLGGRHAGNYVFETPIYTKTVKIFDNKIKDAASGSYVVFPGGMPGDNVTVEFKNAVSSQNKEGLFSSLLGQKAQVVSFSIQSDGIKTDLSKRVKVYVKIPDRFKNAKNLELKGMNELDGAIDTPVREGDYMTFYTARSGEVVFVVSDFPYGIILVAAGILVALFGIAAICLFEPVRKKRALMYKLDDGSEKTNRKKKK